MSEFGPLIDTQASDVPLSEPDKTQPNISRIGSPPGNKGIGRPEKSVGEISVEIPRKRYIVASKSVGPSGRSNGNAPLASLEPIT